MVKQHDLYLFLGSFFISLLLFGWTTVFLYVDTSSSRYEQENMTPALEFVRSDPLHYDVALLGDWYTLTLEPLNQVEQTRKQYACLVTPRAVLNAEKLYGLAVYGWKYYSEKYTNEQYLQNVANEPIQ